MSILRATWTRTRCFHFRFMRPITGGMFNISRISGWRRCSYVECLCPRARCSERSKAFFQYFDFVFSLVDFFSITLWRRRNIKRNITIFFLIFRRHSFHSNWYVVVLTSVRISINVRRPRNKIKKFKKIIKW